MGNSLYVRVGDLVSDGVLFVGDGYRMRNVELGSSGIPFVRGGDINGGGIDHNTDDHIRLDCSDKVSRKLTMAWDSAFITKGTVGRVGILRPEQPSVVFAPQISYWRSLDHEKLWPRFIYYLLKGPEFQACLDADKTHGAMVADYVSISQQHNFRLTIPPIEDQKSIARILGALDDKIDLNRRTNETLEAIARTLFKSWFVDFDPVRAKAEGRAPAGMDAETAALFPSEFEESEFGEIPKGWRVCEMSSLYDWSKDSLKPSQHLEEEFFHYSIPAFDAGKRPAIELGQDIKSQKFLVYRDCVLVSKLNPMTCRVWLPSNENDGTSICSTEFLVARPKEHTPRSYLYSLFVSAPVRDKLTGLASGTSNSHQRVRPADIDGVRVPQPPEALFKAFDMFVKPYLDLVECNLNQNATLAAIRDALLPRLLSGELLIPAAERATEVCAR